MLTTIVERGRIKCHKYWPDIGVTSDFGLLEVTCIKEDTGDNFVFREFSILLKETDEVRQVTQMAYLSWPDHGVPESSQEFVDFVESVRSHRQGSLAPTIGKRHFYELHIIAFPKVAKNLLILWSLSSQSFAKFLHVALRFLHINL